MLRFPPAGRVRPDRARPLFWYLPSIRTDLGSSPATSSMSLRAVREGSCRTAVRHHRDSSVLRRISRSQRAARLLWIDLHEGGRGTEDPLTEAECATERSLLDVSQVGLTVPHQLDVAAGKPVDRLPIVSNPESRRLQGFREP